MFSVKRFFKSFRDAVRGVSYTFLHEQNFRVQIFVGIIAIALAFFLPLRRAEQILILLMTLMVLSTELLNTAVEKFCDLLIPRLHQQISVIKDVMAGAVLLVSIGAGVIGAMIFWPYLVNLFF
ncbi:MAG: diacylglycerol kinase family protein [Candidatus Magasanikbacteria bacterium]|jgi:diacylglycerol kinase (ATP)